MKIIIELPDKSKYEIEVDKIPHPGTALPFYGKTYMVTSTLFYAYTPKGISAYLVVKEQS